VAVDREGRKNKFPHLHAPHDHVSADVCESSGRTVGKKIDRLNSVHGPSLKPDGFRGKEFPCLRASRYDVIESRVAFSRVTIIVKILWNPLIESKPEQRSCRGRFRWRFRVPPPLSLGDSCGSHGREKIFAFKFLSTGHHYLLLTSTGGACFRAFTEEISAWGLL